MKKRLNKSNNVNNIGRAYQLRNEILKQMGYSDYREYLSSDLWKKIRYQVFKMKGNVCWLCKKPADVAHHNRYHRNDLTGKRLKYIFPLCNRCHEKIEFDGGKKASLSKARKKFKKIHRSNKTTRRRL